jgi:hypothetical protein
MKRINEIEPRGLSGRRAADYWGVSEPTFRKLVASGIAPGPIVIPGLDRKFWYRDDIDLAMDRLRDSQRADVAA